VTGRPFSSDSTRDSYWLPREWRKIARSRPTDGPTTAAVRAILRGAELVAPPDLKLVNPLGDEYESLGEGRDGGIERFELGVRLSADVHAGEIVSGDRLATPVWASEPLPDVVGKSHVATFSRPLRRVKGAVQAASATSRARLSACARRASIVKSAWRATRSRPRTRSGERP